MAVDMIPYDKERFRRGGVFAALLPIIIGTILIIRTVKLEDLGAWLTYAPIVISFIIVAPIVASICVSHLKKNAPIDREDILTTSFIVSAKANAWVAIIYNVPIFLFLLIENVALEDLLAGLVLVSVIQFMLWLFVTVPLSFICAIIFELIARPKKQTSPSSLASTNRASVTHKADP